MKNLLLLGLFAFGFVVGWAAKPAPAPPPEPVPRPIDWPRGPDGTPWSSVVVSPGNLLYEAERKYEAEKAHRLRVQGALQDALGQRDAARAETARADRELRHVQERLYAERRLWQLMTTCKTCGPKCKCGIWCQCTATHWDPRCLAVGSPAPVAPRKD